MKENIIYKYRSNPKDYSKNEIAIKYQKLKDDYIDPDGQTGFYKSFRTSKLGKNIDFDNYKSDVFGFSFKETIREYEKKGYYPYDAYLIQLDDNELDEGLNKVEEWIKNTRWEETNNIIGGSFLWSKNIYDKYNRARGGKCNWRGKEYHTYIQDRVDLTLYEIQELYENNFNKIENNKLSGCLDNDLKEYFMEFKSFEKYVDSFKFGDFVISINDKYKTIDIFRSDIKNNKFILVEENIKNIRKNNGDLFDISCEKPTSKIEFETLFNNLQILIDRRDKKLKGE